MALAVLLLAACSEKSGSGAAGAHGAGASEERIACALAGSRKYNADCRVERLTEGGKPMLIIRHPDGGFRRFEVMADGRTLVPADGADKAEAMANGNDLEVTVGDDHYLFPAPAKATEAAPSNAPHS